jgi:hypothetical protein
MCCLRCVFTINGDLAPRRALLRRLNNVLAQACVTVLEHCVPIRAKAVICGSRIRAGPLIRCSAAVKCQILRPQMPGFVINCRPWVWLSEDRHMTHP